MRLAALIVALSLLAGCATSPAPVPPESPEARTGSGAGSTPAVTSPKPVIPPARSPVDSLLEDARRLRDAGDLPASFARLERALRIAPQRAEVYLELARTHRAAQRPERASASAERGLLYCGGDVCTELRRFIAP